MSAIALRKDPIEEATRLISEMNVSSDLKMESNTTPGKLGEPCNVQTNAFGVIVERETIVYVHDIRIFADVSPTKTMEFTKKGKEDCIVNERKEKCTTIIKAMIEQNKDVFPDVFKIFYDGQSLLFTTHKITSEAYKRITIEGKSLQHPDLNGLELIIIEIKPSSSKPTFTLNADALCSQTANLNLADNNHLLTQFIEIAINQYAIMHPERHKVFEYGKTYMTNALEEGLQPQDCISVGDGKTLAVGSKKSVRQIEGPRGRNTNNSCIVIDAMKAAFHNPQTLLEKAIEIVRHSIDRQIPENEREKIQGVVKGLFVETMHRKNNKRIQIFGLSKTTALDCPFEWNGNKITIAQYYKEKYNIHLKVPGAPLMLAKERGAMNCYPMELVRVVPHQRVTIPQQTPQQSQQSTRECAVVPAVRQKYIMVGATALEILNQENPYIKNAGIKVFPSPIKVHGRTLQSPNILYDSKKIECVTEGKWRTKNQRFLIPASIDIWAVYCIQAVRQRKRYEVGDIKKFAETFYRECTRRGMHLKPPTDINIITEIDMEEKIKMAGKHGCQFILFVIADEYTAAHNNMKYYERKYEVVTQQIKLTNMEKIMIENKILTLENIVNKSNMKLGGLNYGLELSKLNGIAQNWFTPDRIILGISISHPAPSAFFGTDSEGESRIPSVVGYSANMKTNPNDFIGDFSYQNARKTDVLVCIQDIINSVVQRHQEAHNGKAAKEIVIYRNGVDEGAFGLALSKEIPLIKAILKKSGYPDIKIAFIVAAKTASDVRLFKERVNPGDKPSQQNIPAGVCVDTQLVHPSFNEFYLNSHTTLQGSAKTPRYTVLVDEIKMSNDHVQGMTFALAHNHQIVALTTGLPAPVYIAARYAERGQNLFTEYTAKEESNSEASSGFDDATRQLTYNITKMRNYRVNA